jgi:DNA-binding HxlR family transcriptional regulator
MPSAPGPRRTANAATEASSALAPTAQPKHASDLRAQLLISLTSGRWTIALIVELGKSASRYQALHDALDGISYKVLTDTLRRAERDGLVARHLDGERIETATLYELTDLGRSLGAPLAVMAEWADRNWQTVEAARRHWDRLRRASD